jgi:peptidoglycan-N-acetylglucosamine deacetylase
MKKSNIALVVVIIVAVLLGGWLWWHYQPDQVTSARYNPDDFKTANSNLFPGVTIEQENKWENDMAIAVQYPQTKNEKVNADIKKFIDQTIADFEAEADKRPQVKDWDDELHVTFVTSGLAPNVLSVKFYVNEYFTDNEQPVSDIVTKLYGLEKGEVFSLADIFVDDVDYLKQLYLLIANALYQDGEITDKSKISAEAGPETDDLQRFTLDSDSITFYFVKGELADHARQVDVPYSKLLDSLAPFIKNHLDSNGRAKSGSDISRVTPTPTATPVPTATPTPTPTPSGGGTCVALTFDDGPHATYTPQKLDILKEKNVPATFFMIGNLVGAHPDVVKRIYAEGHELGNHSWDHAQLSRLSAAEVQSEMKQTQDAIKQITGVAPAVMRPPYGAISDTVEQNVGLPIILWSVDPNDWKDKDRNTVLQRVVGNTKPGSIVLMHDIYGSTADAVPEIIDELKAKGYCFQTVSDLLGLPADTSAQAGQVYRQK